MTARMHLDSRVPSLEISVTDANFNEVARGISRLDAELEPGIYQVRLQAGPLATTKLIALREGDVHQENGIRFDFPAAAPIEGTTTSHEYQMYAARQASAQVQNVAAGAGALVLMIRNLRGMDQIPFDEDRVAGVQILRADLQPLTDSRWRRDEKEKWATLAIPLAQGGYVLRVLRSSRGGAVETFDQSLWVSAGWQTLVFIPNLDGGPAPEWASVHMARTYMGWDPFVEPRIAQALELALWGLREGKAVVPDDLNLLLGSKFQNPMLGIVGAHALLRQAKPNVELLDTVVGNLRQLVGDHPDVAALTWMAHESQGKSLPIAARPAVTWPPMLMASYLALIRLDSSDPGVIVDGSTAETAAARLIGIGVWTAWWSEARRVRRGATRRRAKAAPKDARVERAGVANEFRDVPAELTQDFEDSASRRVARYLADFSLVHEMAAMSEVLEKVPPRQISLATGLPTGSVRRALEEIATKK